MRSRQDPDRLAPEMCSSANAPLAVLESWLRQRRRVLMWGPSGIGKSSLVRLLASRQEGSGQICAGISADPGSPAFGVPGALALAYWRDGSWRVERLAAICTLDAARYRLPLVRALSQLASEVPGGSLLLDSPGVVRGPAARELLEATVEVADIESVLAILPGESSVRDHAKEMLDTLDCEVLVLSSSPLARRPSKSQRALERTRVWDAFLKQAALHDLSLSHLRLTGRPPCEFAHWIGRQLALMDRSGNTLGLGEVVSRDAHRVRARLCRIGTGNLDDSICLMRDAARGLEGLLGTVNSARTGPPAAAVPPDLISPGGEAVDPACFVHLGAASGLLVNGVLGDPLLHLRLRQQRRSLLFDLGDSGRLPGKIVHQVSDVFISHAHMDHIGGFLWFLRSRIGEERLCRLYGPPGLADHICAFIAGVRWDRIADRGPRFEVLELHGERLRRFSVQVGRPRGEGEEQQLGGGLLLDERGFRVRAVTLDHGIPVLAFAFEVPHAFRIRKDRFAALGLSGGPWIGTLKRSLMAGQEEMQLTLPDGRRVPISRLARDLVERQPQRSLVYATDLADSPANRSRLIDLARGADALICEAAFSRSDSTQAVRTGHLTARACGEIAAQAGVARLVPFHFSRRYQSDPSLLYDEVEAVFSGTLVRSRVVGAM